MTARPVIRAVIDEAAFRDLVAGRVATLRTADGGRVEIILSDIGWSRMLLAIDAARGEPYAREAM